MAEEHFGIGSVPHGARECRFSASLYHTALVAARICVYCGGDIEAVDMIDQAVQKPDGKLAPSSPSATSPPAASCRSTPMAAAFPTCIPACTKISVCHGVGGMFAASGTIIMSNEPP
jgi:hypothetical protein